MRFHYDKQSLCICPRKGSFNPVSPETWVDKACSIISVIISIWDCPTQFGESLGWGDGSVRSQNWHLNVKKGFSVYLRAFPDEVEYTSMSLEVRSYCWLSPGLLWAILKITEKTKINWFSYNDLTCMQVFWTNDKFFHNLTEWNLWTSNLSHLGPYLSSVSEQEITPNWPKMIRVTHLCFYF